MRLFNQPLPDYFSPAEFYHENSKNASKIFKGGLSNEGVIEHQLKLTKHYDTSIKVPLISPSFQTQHSYEKIITSRRTGYGHSGEPISAEELSYLLYYGYGVTGTASMHWKGKDYAYPLRAAPAGGALYSVEIYPVVLSVTGVEPGLYHFEAERFQLALLKRGDFRNSLKDFFMQEELLNHAAVIFLFTGLFPHKEKKYGQRAYRLILLDAGHIGENIYLSATALHLLVAGAGGYLDDVANEFLGIDGVHEAMIHAMSIGKAKVGGRDSTDKEQPKENLSKWTKVPMIHERVKDQPLSNAVIIWRPDLGTSLTIEGTGAAMWSLIDGKRNLRAIADAILEEYEVAPETLEEELSQFIDRMVRKEYLTTD